MDWQLALLQTVLQHATQPYSIDSSIGSIAFGKPVAQCKSMPGQSGRPHVGLLNSCTTFCSMIRMHVVVSLGNALHVGSKSCLYEFTELNFLSVGSQLPPRNLNTLID